MAIVAGVAASAVEIRWLEQPPRAGDPVLFAGALALRERVFCDEQGTPRPDADERDAEAEHLVAIGDDGEQVVGTLRLLRTGASAKIGRVAVARERRGEGIASNMLGLALQRASELGCTRAVLSAQTRATGLYRRAGFAVESEVYLEVGIEHVRMGRTLP